MLTKQTYGIKEEKMKKTILMEWRELIQAIIDTTKTEEEHDKALDELFARLDLLQNAPEVKTDVKTKILARVSSR